MPGEGTEKEKRPTKPWLCPARALVTYTTSQAHEITHKVF